MEKNEKFIFIILRQGRIPSQIYLKYMQFVFGWVLTVRRNILFGRLESLGSN
jgi:hypothetical protein